jgi:cytochrome c biogenesis protein CcmG, thiol:disulfide interchange protein DsbE
VLLALPRLQPQTGTLVIVAAGRTAGSVPATSVQLHGSAGWTALGSLRAGTIPAAPEERELIALPVAAGTYDGLRLGDDQEAIIQVVVTAGQVEPVLLGLDHGGRLIAGAAYAGNDQVNLGLGELSGKFVAMLPFSLKDQEGNTFDSTNTAGKDLVIAAFHTTCHETCPLYTAMFLQLQKRLPPGVLLVEVTTDPSTDTTDVLARYATSIGAKWTFVTGSINALTAFWQPFGVALASGDSHVSTLALIDRHGYVRLVYRGVPDVGNDIPAALVTQLSARGLQELASHGEGWGAAEVLKALVTIRAPEQASTGRGGPAPAFSLQSTDGTHVTLSALAGQPLVINFWATYCPPCRAEMPLLQRRVGAQAGIRLVLIDEGDSAEAARDFLRSAGVTVPALLDADLAVGHEYGVVVFPSTFFVRADGTIAAMQPGQLDDRVLAAQLSKLGTQ